MNLSELQNLKIPIKSRKIEIPNQIWERLKFDRFQNLKIIFINKLPVFTPIINKVPLLDGNKQSTKIITEESESIKKEIERRAKENGRRGIYNLLGILRVPSELKGFSWQEIRKQTRDSLAKHILNLE